MIKRKERSGWSLASIILTGVMLFAHLSGIFEPLLSGDITRFIVTIFLIIFVGFSSWLMLPIRANAGTIINENDPSDARLLLAYYNLEQYQKTYLFYGPMYTDQYAGLNTKNPYTDEKPKYENYMSHNTADERRKEKVINSFKNYRRTNSWDSEYGRRGKLLSGHFNASFSCF